MPTKSRCADKKKAASERGQRLSGETVWIDLRAVTASGKKASQ